MTLLELANPMMQRRVDDTSDMTDARKIGFSLQLVILLLSTFASALLAGVAVTYGIRSDVRDILTRQELNSQLQSERMNTMHELIQDDRKRQELLEIEIRNLTVSVNDMKAKMTR